MSRGPEARKSGYVFGVVRYEKTVWWLKNAMKAAAGCHASDNSCFSDIVRERGKAKRRQNAPLSSVTSA